MYTFNFGKEEALKYGDIVREKLAGKIISKRSSDDGLPGSLSYEAEQLHIEGFNLWTFLYTLEGMCRLGTAKEIDDSHYLITTK